MQSDRLGVGVHASLTRRCVMFVIVLAMGMGGFEGVSSLKGQVVTSYSNMSGMSDAGQMYMEGYFMPPVTSSPAYPSWSPDGERLAFSYQGRIWAVPVEGGVARQLSTGPGYHAQPEWSPDGDHIVYTGDVKRNPDIYVLEVETGERRRITSHSKIDVRPRWSPDGEKLLFTSARSGYFDLWSYDLESEELTRVVHSRGYHDMAGEWISGAGDIVFISGRGEGRLGSGELWRSDSSGVSLLRSEETNYQTAPVVSPEAPILAYISHEVGNNELYLLPTEGGRETTRLTHTEKDEFFPAWSPDGERIAYVRNGGDSPAGKGFRLFTISKYGGKPRPVEIDEYQWTEPTGTISVQVSDSEGGTLPSRIYLTASDGRSYFPQGSLVSVVAMTEDYYFHSDGEFSVTVPAGSVTVEAWRGFEYTPAKRTVNVREGTQTSVTLEPERWTDMAAKGWYSGDNHIHVNYGGHYYIEPRDLLHKARAEDLNVSNGMVSNKYSRIMDREHFQGHPHEFHDHPYEEIGLRRSVYYAEEYRPRWYGHLSLLNISELFYPIYPAYGETVYPSYYPHNAPVLREVHEQGGVGGYVHPFGLDHAVWATGNPAWGDFLGTEELPVDAALGLVDFYDLACVWTDEEASAKVWYRLLNTGARLAATAGSDAMTDIWRRPAIGGTRVYVQTGEDTVNYDSWIEAMTAGRAFVTTGPMISLDVSGKGMGQELNLSEPDTVTVEAIARSIFTMHRLEIIKNGNVIRTVSVGDDPNEVSTKLTVPMEESGWIAAKVIGPLEHGLMDSYAYAHTNPVYVLVDGEPIRSANDAAYFARWIRRNLEQLQENGSWQKPSNKEEVFQTFHKALNIYEKQANGRR